MRVGAGHLEGPGERVAAAVARAVAGELQGERAPGTGDEIRVAGVEAGDLPVAAERLPPTDARYTSSRRPVRVESVSVVPVIRQRRHAAARRGTSAPPCPPHPRRRSACSRRRADGHPGAVGGVRRGCSRCIPRCPSTRVPPNTALTATSSSGVPSDTRSVSTQFVPRSGRCVRAADVAGSRRDEDRGGRDERECAPHGVRQGAAT